MRPDSLIIAQPLQIPVGGLDRQYPPYTGSRRRGMENQKLRKFCKKSQKVKGKLSLTYHNLAFESWSLSSRLICFQLYPNFSKLTKAYHDTYVIACN